MAAPVEPTNIKVVKDTITVTIDGETYERTVDRAIEVRPPLTWRLSPNGGFPTIAVPAGFTREVYDRAMVRASRRRQDCRRSGRAEGVALPVSIDFLGRPFSEPTLDPDRSRLRAGDAASPAAEGISAAAGQPEVHVGVTR